MSRPRMTPEDLDSLQAMYEVEGLSMKQICARTGRAPSTLSRHFRARGVVIDPVRGVRGPRPRARAGACVVCGTTDCEIPRGAAKCPPCLAEYRRWYVIERKYGISKDGYIRLLDEQRGRCGVCGKVPDYDLRVDHDHQTGDVRGLLCGGCNAGLGLLGDSVEGLEAGLRYLRRRP